VFPPPPKRDSSLSKSHCVLIVKSNSWEEYSNFDFILRLSSWNHDHALLPWLKFRVTWSLIYWWSPRWNFILFAPLRRHRSGCAGEHDGNRDWIQYGGGHPEGKKICYLFFMNIILLWKIPALDYLSYLRAPPPPPSPN
jgi:hypothetical protein